MILSTSPSVTSVSKTGSTPLVGAITLTETANQVLIAQSGQAITFSLPQSIHTGATPTFAQLNVDNLRLDGNTISSTDTNGNVVIDPDGTGSFDLLTEKQRWLGTQMVIQDVLARDIITATGVLMTISHLNLLIEESIQVDGPIEVQDTVDLNKVTGTQIRVLPDNATMSGSCIAMAMSSTLTFDTNSDIFQFVLANGEFRFTTSPTFGIPPVFFQYIPTIRATTTNLTLSGIPVFYNQAAVVSDGVVLTFPGDVLSGFGDIPSFSVANSGTFASTATAPRYTSFFSQVTINTGITFNRLRSFAAANYAGSGSCTTQIGFFCGNLTSGTTNIGFYQTGTGPHNRFQGKVRMGADSAPTGQLDITCGSASTIGLMINAAASVSSDVLEILDSSANVQIAVDSNFGFISNLVIPSGTLTTRQAITINNGSGAGAITNQYGLVIANLTKGGTLNIPLYIQGTGSSGNRIIPKTKFGADSSPSVDVDINGAMSLAKATVSLTADNQNVTTTNIGYISLSSNNATATNRTFTLGQSTVAGHILILEWTGTNAGELIDDSAQGTAGNHRLSANWIPTQYDTLTLMSNGTDWIEIARSTN